MTYDDDDVPSRERWARFRFAIVGPLLAAPPERGQLSNELERLAQRTWIHPITSEPVHFGVSTIERWFNIARKARHDPLRALRPRVRRDAGHVRSLSLPLREALRAQYRLHPGWSVQLHYDNLRVLVREDPRLGSMPSYASVRRYLKANGMHRQRRRKAPRDTPGAQAAARRLAEFEVRSYEAEYVHGLWHTDYHQGSRSVITAEGQRVRPELFGALDDRSRVACHLQWYLNQSTETFTHGLSQGFQKRRLPRALMSDCGSPMRAAEVTEGLARLGIAHEPTLPYSPHQNAKQEAFWISVEGRLLPMLEGVEELTLDLLNRATQAWAELEYNRSVHEELGCSPLECYLSLPDVGRDCPPSEALADAFRRDVTRTLRRSDLTFRLEGLRFEVPSRYRHLEKLRVRYARWDLSRVDLLDPHTNDVLCPVYPLDKHANADGRRRALTPLPDDTQAPDAHTRAGDIAPLLRHLMAEYAATGLPPAYLPLHRASDTPEESES